jgi:hypothetical protein
VAFLGGVAPAEIASLAFGKGATRAQPALDMLSAYGDPEWFSGTGRECGERLAHLPTIDELGRLAGIMGRIARIRGVDGL